MYQTLLYSCSFFSIQRARLLVDSNVHERTTFANVAKFVTSEGNSALLPASTRDQTVTEGGIDVSVRFSNCVFFFHDEESFITNRLMTYSFGRSGEFCSLESPRFPRIRLGKHRDSRETNSLPVIKCVRY